MSLDTMVQWFRRTLLEAQWAEHVSLTFHSPLRKLYTKYRFNQKQELPVAAMFFNRSGQMSILYRGPSIYASYQAVSEKKIF